MHYYQFNIGDYASHTSHLDPLEDIAYRRMLDWCYTHETPLPNDVQEVARLIRMRDHAAIVRDVLNWFFEQTEDGWFSSRVAREIAHFKAKIEQASKAGKASAERRLNARSTDVQPTNNHKPITNNQEPKKKPANAGVSCPAEVETKVWEDWLQIRKAKKLPLTDTAWQQMTLEAGKAGVTLDAMIRECCLRNWASFKADWYEKEKKAAPTFVEQRKQTLSGLTRGLLGGDGNVKLLGN